MIRRSVLAAAVAAVSLMGRPAAAQRITSPYEFVDRSQSLQLYGTWLYTDRGIIDIGPGTGPAVGFGYTVRISGPFTFDSRLTYFPTTRRVFDVVPTDSAELRANPKAGLELLGTAELALLLVDASLRFDVTGPRTWYNLQPYALIGAGGVVGVSSENAAEADLPTDLQLRVRFQNGFTGHIGAGVEWYATDRFTLRVEGRDLLWKLHVPPGFIQPGRVIDTTEWVQTGHVNIGVAFRF